MKDFKLVVVSNFNDFKKGDQIHDPMIVEKILTEGTEMSHFRSNCQKVLKSSIEKQLYIPPLPENRAPEKSEPEPEPETMRMESIKPKKSSDASNPKE